MALIGQIAIAMKVETTGLSRGLSNAAGMVRDFERQATADFKSANRVMGAGLRNISDGMQAIGILSTDAAKSVAKGAVMMAGSFKPVREAALASAEALRYTYGGAAKFIGRGLAKASSPIVVAAKASASSLSYVYGPFFEHMFAQWRAVGQVAVMTGRGLAPLAASLGTVAVGMGKVAGAATLAGRGLLSLGAAGATKAIYAAEAAIGRIVSVSTQAAGHLAKLGAVAVGVGAYGWFKVAKAASDVTEAMNLARIEFGDSSGVIIAEANRMSAAFGASKKETIEAAAAFAASFKEAGLNGQQSADMAVQFVRRMKDLESAKNLAPGAAFEKLQSALAGEIKPLRDIGYAIDENLVKQQAYAMGIAKVGAELTQQQKFQARIPLILGKTANIQGDLAKTATEVAGAWRTVAGRVESLAEKIGEMLEPITKSLLNEMGAGLKALQMYWTDNQNAVVSWATGATGAIGKVDGGIGVLQQSIVKVADAWHSVETSFESAQLKIMQGFGWMLKNLPGFSAGLSKIMQGNVGVKVEGLGFGKGGLVLGGDPTSPTIGGFQANYQQEIDRKQKALADKLAHPPSATINTYFDKARQDIEKLRAEALGLPGAKPPIIGAGLTAGTKPTKHKEVKFASAAVKGSQEAANTILRSRFAGGQTVNEQKKQTNLQTRMAAGIDKIAAATSRDVSMFVLENF
jgi:hypothetical protein